MGRWEMGHKCRVKSAECRASPWAAGTGSPAGSPYAVGVKEPTENQSNGIVEIFVFKTAGSNVRLQRCRGEPQARPSPASRRVPFGVNLYDLFLLLYLAFFSHCRYTKLLMTFHI